MKALDNVQLKHGLYTELCKSDKSDHYLETPVVNKKLSVQLQSVYVENESQWPQV